MGQYVFANCISLTNVVLSNSLKEIPSYSFFGCYSLANIIIPDSVRIIGNYVFERCNKLTKLVAIGEGNNFSEEDGEEDCRIAFMYIKS